VSESVGQSSSSTFFVGISSPLIFLHAKLTGSPFLSSEQSSNDGITGSILLDGSIVHGSAAFCRRIVVFTGNNKNKIAIFHLWNVTVRTQGLDRSGGIRSRL
jgi:hypothetical protein